MNSEEILTSIVSTTLLVLLLTSGIIITFFISGRQRVRQRVELAETKLTFERELRQVETEVSEHIMSQFAQELHDNIGQLLTATHIQIENQKLDHPTLADGFKTIEIYLGEITQQLRLLSRTMNHDYLGHIGLFSALQLEVERLRALRRFTIHWQAVEGVSYLEKNQELMVFRIFQEITQNALRHSGAKNLYISIALNMGFKLTVRDDGQGFDKESIFSSGKASGLRNIIKRATLAGMVCEIDVAPGKGCLFILKKIDTLV
jgi:two-component system NarL family sensor kinase